MDKPLRITSGTNVEEQRAWLHSDCNPRRQTLPGSTNERRLNTMSMTYAEMSSAEVPAYGGLVDAIGGIATAVLAIVALTGYAPGTMGAIATVIFGAALLIQGGTVLSEYAHVVFPAEAASPPVEKFAGGGLSALFMVGIAGIVLGILAL